MVAADGPVVVSVGMLLGLGRVEQAPDAAGEVSFEAADRFLFRLAFAVSAIEVGAGRGVGAGAREGDYVQRAVELAVAAAVFMIGVGGSRGANVAGPG